MEILTRIFVNHPEEEPIEGWATDEVEVEELPTVACLNCGSETPVDFVNAGSCTCWSKHYTCIHCGNDEFI